MYTSRLRNALTDRETSSNGRRDRRIDPTGFHDVSQVWMVPRNDAGKGIQIGRVSSRCTKLTLQMPSVRGGISAWRQRSGRSAASLSGVHLSFAADSIGCGILGKARIGHVVAVFERACILALQDAQMIALLTRSVGNIAHGIRLNCSPQLDRMVQIGMPACFTRERVVIGCVTVLLCGARVWSTNLRAGMCRDRKALTAILLARQLLQGPLNVCRSELLQIVLQLNRNTSVFSGWIAATLPQLSHATLRLDHQAALASLSKLIGLGPGLTPSGDDFIIGWLAGVMLMTENPAQHDFLDMVRSGLMSLSNGTTPISRQHLQDAAKGEFSELLSDVCFAMASGAREAQLADTLSRQLSVGATSGADAAAGLMFALFNCSSVFGPPDHRPVLGERYAYPSQNRPS
jgi:Protein of unknown function (DUF2877)